jgi:hypothetical protein
MDCDPKKTVGAGFRGRARQAGDARLAESLAEHSMLVRSSKIKRLRLLKSRRLGQYEGRSSVKSHHGHARFRLDELSRIIFQRPHR